MALGPYRTIPDGRIAYVGNRIHAEDFKGTHITLEHLRARPDALGAEAHWSALSRVNGALFSAAVQFFETQTGARFVPLPLTTRMISSPGAAFGPNKIDYTTDTAPVRLDWFGTDCFLSESSQIYLELALTQPGLDEVYSIYNSFRRENADATHLSEFHHVEFEGRGELEWCANTAEGLVRSILERLVDECAEELLMFLRRSQFDAITQVLAEGRLFHRLSLREAYDRLLHDTQDPRYRTFTLEDRFGKWEEVRLTELLGGPVAVTGYPLLEVPFYHAQDPDDGACALNTDMLWAGYVEIAGIGQRIGDISALREKAAIFNLPNDDYAPYMRARQAPRFTVTSGFGLGWQRLIHGLLCLPRIDLACLFPRTHLGPIP